MRNKILLGIIGLFATAVLVGTTYSAWVFENTAAVNNTIQIEVPQ